MIRSTHTTADAIYEVEILVEQCLSLLGKSHCSEAGDRLLSLRSDMFVLLDRFEETLDVVKVKDLDRIMQWQEEVALIAGNKRGA